MTPDAIHAVTHHWATFAVVHLLGASLPVLGWMLAMALVGPRARAGRAAWCVGLAVLGLPLPWLLIRLLVLVQGGGLAGLLAPLGTPAAAWHPHDAIVLLVLPIAAFHLVLVELFALVERQRGPRGLEVPLGLPVALVCIGAAVLGSLAGIPSLQQGLTELVASEVFAFAPVTLIALAIWTRSFDQVPQAAEDAADDPATLEHVDIPRRWTAVGALIQGAASFLKEPGVADDTDSAGAPVWAAAGGDGACPGVVDALVETGIAPGEAWQVGDLPAPTEELVVTAAVVASLRRHGRQVLVIGPEPEVLASALRSADSRTGTSWPVGPTIAGLPALRQALADGKLPAAAFLSTADLSGGALRTMAREANGRLWARSIGLVVLAGFDRGGPLLLTHRVHTLRRLKLVLDPLGARPGVLLTSHRSRAARMLVQQAFPGITVQEAPLRPRQTRPLTVWLADYHFVLRSPSGWVRQAAEPIAVDGHRVRVSDPSGSFDEAGIAVWDGDVKLTPRFTLEGEASVGLLDATALIGAWRAIPNRVRAVGDLGRHHALWSLIDEPVTRYLLGDDRLRRLTASDELPAPAAVAALQNKLLARGHLRAALHESSQDLAALEAAFGASMVDQVREEASIVGHAVRRGTRGVVRTPRLGRSAEDPGDPMGAVGQTAQVVDGETGTLLRVVDALTAPTRYYPRRVFAHGGRRFTVPLGGERGRIEVEPVAPDVALTTPRLTVEVTSRGVREAEQHHTRGRFRYAGSIHAVLVVETVQGAVGADGAVVQYEPVTTRYLTASRVLVFDATVSRTALAHLAAVLGDVLRALLLVQPDDLAVVPLPTDWAQGLAVIERSVQGLGVAEVLDERRVARAFDWVHAILTACPCEVGCASCTPAWHVATGALDKPAVVRLLTGTHG